MIQFIYIAAILAAAGLLTLAAGLLSRKGVSLTPFLRTAALVLAAVAFYAYLKEQAAVYAVRGLNMYSPFGDAIPLTVLSVLLIWFTYAAMLLTILSTFFDYPTLKHLTHCFALPVCALDLIFFNVYMTGLLGTDAFTAFDIRLPFIAVQLALTVGIVLASVFPCGYALPSKKETRSMLYALPFAVFAIMPAYVPQALIGFADASIKAVDFTESHRLALYFSIIIPFAIFHALKDKSEDVKRFVMIYLSLGLLFVYLGRWELIDFADPLKWPLHLCNTAMFLIPLCIIFRMRRLFNFCLFVNVVGAFLAMILPNEFANVMETESISFWINHYAAFFMPILLVALGIFKRPKFKEWVYALLAFFVYFFSILFVNAWFSNYGDSDFFFLNSDFIVSSLGIWAERTRDLVVSFTMNDPLREGVLSFTFYPVYQTLFFIAYIAFTVGVWFLYALLFRTWDASEERREKERSYKMMKKDLQKFLGGKSINEPISGDSSPRLVLKSFSKKYGSNNFYSVKDVSFDVKGGEIFGFLGPNGAGKSTIIKSIVGIQTITSGAIEVCGYDVDKQPVQAKLELGFVPDHYALYENLTGREYINYIADLYRVDAETRNETIEKYVTRFQLTESFDNQMKTYSHGMKQKIAIMAALVHNPKVWILDEPLTGLDPTSIHAVKECMKEHAANGNIVFFSSHIIDVVEKICDRIAIIKKGELRACTSVAALEEKGIELEQFYLSIIHADTKEESVASGEVLMV